MTEPIITHMRQYATHLIEQCYQGKLLELNGEPDHIHILFELPATAAPSVVVCSLKTQLSKEVHEQNFGMRSKISSGRIASGQTVISLPLPEAQTLKHWKDISKTKGIEKPKRKYTKRQAKKM